jgi:magnesium chelatase subunit D
MRRLCCELCLEAHAAGHRGDIVMRLAARALAALDSRPEVSEADVRLAAEMALLHRVRNAPPPPPEQEQQQQQEQEQEHEPDQDQPEQQEQDHSAAPPEESREEQNQSEPEQQEDTESESQRPALESVFPVGDPFRVKSLSLARDRTPRKGSGKRTRSRTPLKAGRYVRSRPDSKPADLALDATLRAAAVHQKSRSRPGMAVAVEDEDLMRKVREKRVGGFIVFAVDASGSMGANRRMVETKGAVLSLLLDAYQKRDMVSFVAFRGEEAEMLLPPTNSVELAYRRLDELPTGGKTPLSAGLALARQTLENQLRKDPSAFPVLVLISDGRANASRFGGKPLAEAMDMARAVGDEGRIRSVVIDVEKPGLVNFGLAGELAEHMGGRCFKIEDLRAETLVDILRREILPG